MKIYEVKSILIDWLKDHVNCVIGNHIIETEVPQFAKRNYQFPDGDPVVHSPGTFSREWRGLRSDKQLLESNHLRIEEVAKNGSAEKHFKICDARLKEQIDLFK